MALPDQRQLQSINEIAEALCCSERRRLLYLCESLDTENSVGCLKTMLKTKVMCYERGDLFLAELMLQLRRFDILRTVFRTSREEVERNLNWRQVLPRFRVLMANISEDMANEDLDCVKFLLSSTLTREKIEKTKNFLDVIIELEKLDMVSPERVDLVEECLQNIGRRDLAKRVTAYKKSAFIVQTTLISTATVQSSSFIVQTTLISTATVQSSFVTAEQHSFQPQQCRAPHPLPPSNSSHPLQQTRQGQSLHSATEIPPAPVYREQNCQSHLDCYKFNTNPRGVCVIIDCVGNDGDMLKQTFKALHFNVLLYKWLSVDETLLALKRILRQRENVEGDAIVCCIISRGTSNHILGTNLRSPALRLDNVRRLFTADACPKLAGKPKLFFIQRYRVPEFQPFATMHHRDEDLDRDELSRSGIIPTDADVFWSHCWTDERQLEPGHHRSIYLKALTDALHKGQRRKTHLVDVHTEVNGAIFEHNKRNRGANYHIDLKHTLRKNLYLQ